MQQNIAGGAPQANHQKIARLESVKNACNEEVKRLEQAVDRGQLAQGPDPVTNDRA